MRRAVLLLAALLALAACGGESGSGSSDAAAGTTSKTPDRTALVQLCSSYCTQLLAQQNVCPTGTTNLTACGRPLAQGSDLVTAVQKGINGIPASEGIDLTSVVSAIAKEQAAYGTWVDNTGCILAFDLNDAELAQIFPGGRTAMFICAAEATTVGLTQASVGATLRNAAQGT